MIAALRGTSEAVPFQNLYFSWFLSFSDFLAGYANARRRFLHEK